MFRPPKTSQDLFEEMRLGWFWRFFPCFMAILQTLSPANPTVKTEFSQAFMARNVKERGFLVDHLMDLIQRCARSPIPKTWTERWETLWYELLKMGWNFVFVFVCTTWKHDWLLCQWSFTASKLRHWTTGPLHADVRMRLLWEALKMMDRFGDFRWESSRKPWKCSDVFFGVNN